MGPDCKELRGLRWYGATRSIEGQRQERRKRWDRLESRQRLQNIRSNSTSPSYTEPRSMPAMPTKRMFRAYLLALISGTHGVSLASDSRSSCATLAVVSIN